MIKSFLRPANESDVDLYFSWANDENVRLNSFSQEPITYDDHKVWFSKKLRDPNTRMFVYSDNDVPVGQIRIDKKDNFGEISFSIDSTYRGKGYGTLVLKLVRETILKSNLTVEFLKGFIKCSNSSSIHAFERAGYFCYSNSDGILEYRCNYSSADLSSKTKKCLDNTVVSRLTLGTAQLGLNYGIANTVGKPDQGKVNAILDAAVDTGITTLDTAFSYGDSEKVIGNWLVSRNISVNIISKTPNIPLHLKRNELKKCITGFIRESLKNLNVDCLWGLLLHNIETLYNYKSDIILVLEELKSENLIDHFGVSVYDPDELKDCLQYQTMDIFQAPVNCIDRRWRHFSSDSDFQNKLLFVRSVYLQGLLLMDGNLAESKVAGSKHIIQKLESLAKEFNVSRKMLVFAYVNRLKLVHSIVIGADRPEHVYENASLLEMPVIPEECFVRIETEFIDIGLDILDPRKWNKS